MTDLSLFKSLGSLKEFVLHVLYFSAIHCCHSLYQHRAHQFRELLQLKKVRKFLLLPFFFTDQITFQTSGPAAQALMPAQTRELEHTAMNNKDRTAALSSIK